MLVGAASALPLEPTAPVEAIATNFVATSATAAIPPTPATMEPTITAAENFFCSDGPTSTCESVGRIDDDSREGDTDGCEPETDEDDVPAAVSVRVVVTPVDRDPLLDVPLIECLSEMVAEFEQVVDADHAFELLTLREITNDKECDSRCVGVGVTVDVSDVDGSAVGDLAVPERDAVRDPNDVSLTDRVRMVECDAVAV
jgi:hypothetical protein